MRLIDAEMLPWENQHIDEFGDWSLKVYEIEEMPTIDPVHSAGACYCVECSQWKRAEGIFPDGTKPDYGWCEKLLNADSETEILTSEKDFCSFGEKQ